MIRNFFNFAHDIGVATIFFQIKKNRLEYKTLALNLETVFFEIVLPEVI